MDFQAPCIYFAILWKSLIPKLGVAVFEVNSISKDLCGSYNVQHCATAYRSPHNTQQVRGQCRGWMLEGPGIVAEVKMGLKLKQEFKVGNAMGSQRGLVRE